MKSIVRTVSLFVIAIFAIALAACSPVEPKTPIEPVPIVDSSAEMPESTEAEPVEAEPVVSRATFLALGDIVAHDQLVYQGRTGYNEYDFTHIFAPMASVVASYDVAAITQETPFVTDDADVSGYPCFGTPVQMGDAIRQSGFDVVVGATNHSMDKGTYGIDTTLSYWEAHPEITHLGMHRNPQDANSVSVREVNGIKIAFTDCTYGLNGFVLPEGYEHTVDLLYDLDQICDNIRTSRDKVDVVVAFVHMGEEYATVPSDEQRDVAARLVDAGADVVIGSHVHVVQPCEEITTAAGNHGVVYYSIGNHVSNQIEAANMLGGAASMTFEKTSYADGTSKTEVIEHSFEPVVCHFDGGTTCEYFLVDYPDEKASYNGGGAYSTDMIWGMWTDITGLGRDTSATGC